MIIKKLKSFYKLDIEIPKVGRAGVKVGDLNLGGSGSFPPITVYNITQYSELGAFENNLIGRENWSGGGTPPPTMSQFVHPIDYNFNNIVYTEVPTQRRITSIAYNGNVIVSVADHSSIPALVSSNGGDTWTVPSGISTRLHTVKSYKGSFFALSWLSELFSADSNGDNWNSLVFLSSIAPQPDGSMEYPSIETDESTNTIMVGGDMYDIPEERCLFRSTDDGNTWTSLISPITSILSICRLNNFWLIAGENDNFAYSTNNGDSWTVLPFPNTGGGRATSMVAMDDHIIVFNEFTNQQNSFYRVYPDLTIEPIEIDFGIPFNNSFSSFRDGFAKVNNSAFIIVSAFSGGMHHRLIRFS